MRSSLRYSLLAGNLCFSRTWTLQEILRARKIRFVRGYVVVPLEVIWRGGVGTTLFLAAYIIWHEGFELRKFVRPRMFFDNILNYHL